MAKLAIRTDRKNGLVRAYFSSLDDSDRFEVATLSIKLADKIEGALDRWVALLTDLHKTAIEEATGEKVTSYEIFRPHRTEVAHAD